MNALEDMTAVVKSFLELLTDIYKDLPKKSVQNIGTALGTVMEFATLWRHPLNCYNEKVKMIWKKNIENYAKKLEAVPDAQICEVPTQLGVPILEKLSYITNDDIADLFTTLLANASNTQRISEAHPAFVQLIERLSPDEARIIKYLQNKTVICYSNFKAHVIGSEIGFITIVDHATTIEEEVSLDYKGNINVYWSNLVSMGVLVDMAGTWKINNNEVYDKIKILHNYDKLCHNHSLPKFKELKEDKSFYKITSFGKLFISACTKL